MDSNSKKWTFKGVTSPNSTQIPDVLFDELLSVLSGAELKVLFYVSRRTFGFKKDSDNISLSQLLDGIRRKDGTVLDRGTGLTKKTLLKALTSLTDHQVIFRERRRSASRGDEATVYRLNLGTHQQEEKSTPPVGEKVHQGVGEKLPLARGGKSTPHKLTVLQQTDRQHHDDAREALLSFGISSNRAQELIDAYPGNLILKKLEFVEFLVSSDSSLVGRNPQGFLIKAITEGYLPTPPRGFKSRKQREEENKKQRLRAKEIEQVEQKHLRQIRQFGQNHQPQPIPKTKMDTRLAWQKALGLLRDEVSQSTYQTWLKNSVLASCDAAGRAIIGVPHQFAADWLAKHLKPSIAQSLTEVLGRPTEIRFEVLAPKAIGA